MKPRVTFNFWSPSLTLPHMCWDYACVALHGLNPQLHHTRHPQPMWQFVTDAIWTDSSASREWHSQTRFLAELLGQRCPACGATQELPEIASVLTPLQGSHSGCLGRCSPVRYCALCKAARCWLGLVPLDALIESTRTVSHLWGYFLEEYQYLPNGPFLWIYMQDFLALVSRTYYQSSVHCPRTNHILYLLSESFSLRSANILANWWRVNSFTSAIRVTVAAV